MAASLCRRAQDQLRIKRRLGKSTFRPPLLFLLRGGGLPRGRRHPPECCVRDGAQAGGIAKKTPPAFSIICCLLCLLYVCLALSVSLCLSVSLSVSLSVFSLSAFLSVCLSYLSLLYSVLVSLGLSPVCLPLCLALSVFSVCLSVYLSVLCLAVCCISLCLLSLFLCLSLCNLYIWPFSTIIFQAIFFSYRRHIWRGCRWWWV